MQEQLQLIATPGKVIDYQREKSLKFFWRVFWMDKLGIFIY